jgi:hypothetical protein
MDSVIATFAPVHTCCTYTVASESAIDGPVETEGWKAQDEMLMS